MTSDFSGVPFLSNIGLVMTYKCQIACPHCIIEAGPRRREEVSLTNAFNWIQEIASYRNCHITFLSLTGGEPFYNRVKLKKIAAFGEARGLLVGVVTNAFWAYTQEKAVEVLRELPEIKLLALSTDIYHQQFIPIDRIRNAILAAKECGVPYYVTVCTENENDGRYREILRKLQETTEIDTIKPVITFPFGRAAKTLGVSKYETSDEPPTSACLASSYPIIFPDGSVIACVGPLVTLKSRHPLLLGSIRERSLHEIFDDAELNPILHAIRIWGPRRLISMIKDAGLNQHLPRKYIRNSVCYACHAVFSNSEIVKFLCQLANDPEFARKVAYARVYYLKETTMVDRSTWACRERKITER
jgi:MoaA/NifB/PqqE/SkfB family radical SAM enzyme